MTEVREQLRREGILIKSSPISRSIEEYKAFVGVQDWTPLSPEEIAAHACGVQAMAWLKSKTNDSLRGGRPLSLFARAVAPHLDYSYSGKTCEFYDEQRGVWVTEGAEGKLREQMEIALMARLVSYKIVPVCKDSKIKFAPVAEPTDLFLLDPSVQASIFSCLNGVRSRFAAVALDTQNHGRMTFRNHVTLDFGKPYEEQVQTPAAADRNTRHSSSDFVQCDDEHVRAAGRAIAGCLLRCNDASGATPEEVAAECAPILLNMMRQGGGPMFRHVYYEPAGGQMDGPSPEDKIMEALYSLRQDVGASTGLRAGLEEMLIEWGPSGNNGKGQKKSVRELACGTYQLGSETSNGYIAVCSSKMLVASSDKNQDDIYKAKGCREAVIDEVKKSEKLCNNTCKQCTGGGVISAMAKYKGGRDVDTNWLLRMILNDFPSFDEPLGEADQRRFALIYYGCTFRTPGDEILPYEAGNPTHRVLVSRAHMLPSFAVEYIEWCRLLGIATKACTSNSKRMWPKPASYVEELKTALELEANPFARKWAEFAEQIVPFNPGGGGRKPASRGEIHEAFAEFVGGINTQSQQQMKPIVAFVKGKLEEKGAPWKAPGGRAARDQVRVYQMMDQHGMKRIATLRA